MNYIQSQLYTFPSGLKLVYHYSAGVVSHCGIMVGAGSRNEPEGKAGLAHFIEHVIFKGTGKRNAWQVLNRLESVGGDLNAYTTKEETCVHASMLNEHFERAVELLSDIVFNPVFPEKEIKVEKDVVLDEISSYLDNPSEQIFDDFECLLFRGGPMGNPILGFKESVEGFRRSDLLRFVKEHYRPSQTVFSYVGDLSFEKVKTLAEKYLGHFRKSSLQAKAVVPRKPGPINEIKLRPSAHSHYICGSRAYSSRSPKRFALFLLNNILGGPGMNSRLNMNIREKFGYTYQIESGYHTFSDSGIFNVYFATEPRFFEKCLNLVNREFQKLKHESISPTRLSSYKYQLKGQIALGQENRAGLMLNNARNVLNYNRPLDIESVMSNIDKVTSSDIMDSANEILNERLMSSLLYKEG